MWNFFKRWQKKDGASGPPPGTGAAAKTVASPQGAATVAAVKSTPPKPAAPAPPASDEPQFRVGQTVHVPGLGDFSVHDIRGGKGKSGMGVVYIVLDVSSMTPYAVKTFQKWCLGTPELVQRFLRETETWIRLEQHPNIVRAFYVATIQDQPHVFLEYVAGADLRKKLIPGALPVQDALRY